MMEVEVLGDALLYAKQRQWRVFDVGETGANVVRVRGECPCFRYDQCTCTSLMRFSVIDTVRKKKKSLEVHQGECH